MVNIMQLSDFHYDLPEELIAHYPTPERTASRLLCLDGQTGAIVHRQFNEIIHLIEPGDLLVMNNTRVIPARLFGHKATGGKIEILVERLLDTHRILAHVRASKSPKPGTQLLLQNQITVNVIGKQGDLFELEFLDQKSVLEILEAHGHMPLPPYIQRPDEISDQERYQTVYAKHPGAVAAPTAGLHFDEDLLQQLKAKGVEFAFVTLHVGAGTFQPVRVQNIHEHVMHAEWIEVPKEVCEKIKQTKLNGKRVIAVGTTSVRCLETAALSGEIQPFIGDTQIFIYPGFEFKCVNALITNFHLSESTLLMLVCAFAGYDNVMTAYQVAVMQRYRFFSYGDAMFVSKVQTQIFLKE